MNIKTIVEIVCVCWELLFLNGSHRKPPCRVPRARLAFAGWQGPKVLLRAFWANCQTRSKEKLFRVKKKPTEGGATSKNILCKCCKKFILWD